MQSDESISNGVFTNKTFVTDNIWPDVTCHYDQNRTLSSIPNDPQAIGFSMAGPINSTSWPLVVDCCRDRNITISDTGKGCAAGCSVLPTEPGVVYRCLRSKPDLEWGECSGNLTYACASTALPADAISRYLASATVSASVSASASATGSTTTSSTTTSSSSSSPKPTSAADSARNGMSSKLALVMVIGLLASSLF